MTSQGIKAQLLAIGVWESTIDNLLERYTPEHLALFIEAIEYSKIYQSAKIRGFLPQHLVAEIRKGHVPVRPSDKKVADND